MRSITFIVIFAVFLAITFADTDSNDKLNVHEAISISSNRFKRATCDIIPGIVNGIGHAACAAHCVTRGFKGGWCNSQAVCNCRR